MVTTITEDTNTPSAVAEIKIGGRRYPVVSRPTCRTCQHPDRVEIEHQILSGISYAAIAAWSADQDPGRLPAPSVDSLAAHAKAHMAIAGRVHRAIIDARANQIVLGDDDMAADHVALARLMVKTGMEGLADGTLKPSLGDVMTAARFLADHDSGDVAADIGAWREALMTYMEVAKQFIPPAAWPAFAEALSSQPTLRKTLPALPPGPDRNHP